jgi:hypothetical protein
MGAHHTAGLTSLHHYVPPHRSQVPNNTMSLTIRGEFVQVLAALAWWPWRAPLGSIRVGLNSGEVVVQAIGRHLAERLHRYVTFRQGEGVSCHRDRLRLRHLLHPRRQVRRLADGGAVHVEVTVSSVAAPSWSISAGPSSSQAPVAARWWPRPLRKVRSTSRPLRRSEGNPRS